MLSNVEEIRKLPPKWRICFRFCPLVDWLVCQQDYTKTTEHISSQFGNLFYIICSLLLPAHVPLKKKQSILLYV